MLQRILLFTFLAVSLSAMAGKQCASRTGSHVTTKALHHFSDDTDQRGDIEISVISHVVSAHRQHLKNGHDAVPNNQSDYSFHVEPGQQPVQLYTNGRRSNHLRLIFPSHYFW